MARAVPKNNSRLHVFWSGSERQGKKKHKPRGRSGNVFKNDIPSSEPCQHSIVSALVFPGEVLVYMSWETVKIV